MLDFHGMLRKSSHQPHRESQIQKTRSRHQNETWWAGNCQRMLSSGAWIDTISFHIPEVAQLHHCRHRTQPSHSWKYFQISIIVLIYHLLNPFVCESLWRLSYEILTRNQNLAPIQNAQHLFWPHTLLLLESTNYNLDWRDTLLDNLEILFARMKDNPWLISWVADFVHTGTS